MELTVKYIFSIKTHVSFPTPLPPRMRLNMTILWRVHLTRYRLPLHRRAMTLAMAALAAVTAVSLDKEVCYLETEGCCRTPAGGLGEEFSIFYLPLVAEAECKFQCDGRELCELYEYLLLDRQQMLGQCILKGSFEGRSA